MIENDYFGLLGLPRCFQIDKSALEEAWRSRAAQIHPDRFATKSQAEQRVALNWAALINDAYRQLRNPLLRARYLCEQAGIDVQTEQSSSMAPAFLMQQMEWREQLDQARRDNDAKSLVKLTAQLHEAEKALGAELADLLDRRLDYEQASARIREWMFIEKIIQEIAQTQPFT